MRNKHTIVVALVVSALSAYAEKQPYTRYESIVNRQMFGELPPDFDPTKMPSEVARGSGGKQEKELTKEQEKLQSSIHFSMINVTPDGSTAVGFTDNSNPKTPVHYYLKVGESRDGWKVEKADAKEATMTIVKGDVEVSLSLGGNSGKGGGQASARGAGAQSGPPSTLLGGGTLSGRRRKEAQARAAELQKIREEQAAKDAARAEQAAEEKAQREAEREEQRKQLQAIQEELRKAREEAAKQKESESNANDTAE